MLFESKGFLVAASALLAGLACGVAGCAGADGEAVGDAEQRADSQPLIRPTSAWFGGNCAQQNNHSGPLDITAAVTAQLNGAYRKAYTASGLSDPAYGCDKNLIINYRCGGPNVFAPFAGSVYQSPEAMYRTTPIMDCTNKFGLPPGSAGAIMIETAYYASNRVPGGVDVRFETPPRNGIRSGVKTVCQGANVCDYFVEYKLWGPDPAYGKDKDFHLTYRCTEDRHNEPLRQIDLYGEANHQRFRVDCSKLLPR